MSAESQEITTKEKEEYAYGHIIEALTGGLYPNKLDVIREYIQNSYDAVVEWIKQGNDENQCEIKVDVKGRSIFIYDNGTGMTYEQIGEYRKLGYSKKQVDEYAGWRGIGKVAGMSVAEKLIVTTSPYGKAEKYQLVIDSKSMLQKVIEFRTEGKNISLNELVMEYTDLQTSEENPEDHYTMVQLYNVNRQSKEILNPMNLEVYLAQVAPVPFDASFKTDRKDYGKEIDEHLRQHVRGYRPVKIFVGDNQVFKLYLTEWEAPETFITRSEERYVKLKEPEYISVYDDNGKLLGYCWYCAKDGVGQIKTPFIYKDDTKVDELRGLIYRVKGITVGDNKLPKITLWKQSSHVSYYFLGEIHICDERIKPTSDRRNFEDNEAREVFYEKGWINIGNPLRHLADAQSQALNAVKKIDTAWTEVQSIEDELKNKELPKELIVEKQVEIFKAIEEARKRKRKAPDAKTMKRADEVISKGSELLKILVSEKRKDKDEEKTKGTRGATKDIKEDLQFSGQTILVYDTMINVLRDYFAGKPKEFEKVFNKIYQALYSAFEER